MNVIVNFSPARAVSFYTKILNLVLDVSETMIFEKNISFLKAVYENRIFHELIYPDKEDVFNVKGKKQNIDMFMTKFHGILFYFERELIWSFECLYCLKL